MKILVLANFGMGLYNFRKELLEELISQNHEVYISLPNDEYVPMLKKIGCKFIDTPVNRRGTNPLTDLKLLFNYIKLLRDIKPDVTLTYTIKPNIYGGLACRITNTPFIANLTGLGTAVVNGGLLQKITFFLYKMSFKKAKCIFFQNKENKELFIEKNIISGNYQLIPGSGVNTAEHNFEDYPVEDKEINFLFIGRIMKAKGIDELLEVANRIKKEYPCTQFNLVGGIEEDYIHLLKEKEELGIVNYFGQQKDVRPFIKNSHAIILPSHHEGMANVLLEAASSGRPILASNIPGCVETFDNKISGLEFEVKNTMSLYETVKVFIEMPYDSKKNMGISGREKVVKEFDRKIVVNSYINEIYNNRGELK